VNSFDTHCHLDLYPDPHAIVREAERTQTYVVAVTNTPSVFQATQQLIGNSRFVRPALGLHPELAVERKGELPLFQQLLPQTRYVGEVGLDFVSSDKQVRLTQQRVFSQILEWSHLAGDKILTIHSRRAEKEVVEAIGTNFRGAAILHWYSGSLAVVEQALTNGLYFSINSAMTRSKRFPDLLRLIPIDRLLTETDGPFVQIGQRAALPADVAQVASTLAAMRQSTPEEVSKLLFANLRKLLATPS